MKTFWLSFSNGTNLGCCIIDAVDPKDAAEKATDLGINPGGEVMVTEFDNSIDAQLEIAKWGKNRLISREDLVKDNYIPTSDMPQDIQDYISLDSRVTRICEKCNNGLCQCPK